MSVNSWDDDLPLVLRQDDLARLLDVSTRTVDRYRRSRQIPEPLIDNAHPRWSRDQIVTWLAGGSVRRGRR